MGRTGWIAGAALALAAALTGSTAPAAAPPSGGTIAIEAGGSDAAASAAYVEAAEAAFEARGFTILNDPAHAAYVADLTLSRAAIGTGLARNPNAEPISVGSGINVPISTGASSLVTLQRTRLDIRIRKRGATATVWSGAAVTVRSAGADRRTAADLSAAVLQRYPAAPEGVVGVP